MSQSSQFFLGIVLIVFVYTASQTYTAVYDHQDKLDFCSQVQQNQRDSFSEILSNHRELYSDALAEQRDFYDEALIKIFYFLREELTDDY